MSAARLRLLDCWIHSRHVNAESDDCHGRRPCTNSHLGAPAGASHYSSDAAALAMLVPVEVAPPPQ